MKKIVAILLSLGLMCSLAACGNSSSSKEETDGGEEAASNSNKTIAGIVFQEDQFFNLMTAGYEQAAKDRGYTIQLSNISNDQAKETEVINTYAAQGVAGIAISPLSETISPEPLSAAAEKGVKICVSNTGIDAYKDFAISAYTSDNYGYCYQTGEIAADFIKEHYGDEKVQVGIIQFKTQIPEISAQRVNGFLGALDDAGINYEVVADQDAWLQDVAITKVGDMLAGNPDIDIFFAANDGGTIGATMAVESTGLQGKVYVFGSDASEQIIDLLKADNNILQAVTGQDAFEIGYKTVDNLINILEGKTVEGEGETNIVEGIPLKRGDTESLDAFLEDLKTKM
ncbi:MAG: substrate-binding domain-containing protein [Oliverpabstia sp.]